MLSTADLSRLVDARGFPIPRQIHSRVCFVCDDHAPCQACARSPLVCETRAAAYHRVCVELDATGYQVVRGHMRGLPASVVVSVREPLPRTGIWSRSVRFAPAWAVHFASEHGQNSLTRNAVASAVEHVVPDGAPLTDESLGDVARAYWESAMDAGAL